MESNFEFTTKFLSHHFLFARLDITCKLLIYNKSMSFNLWGKQLKVHHGLKSYKHSTFSKKKKKIKTESTHIFKNTEINKKKAT